MSKKGRGDALPKDMLEPVADHPLASTTGRSASRAQRKPRAAPPKTRAGDGRRVSPTSFRPRNVAAGGRRPAADLVDVAPVRKTVYVRPDHLEHLDAIVAERQHAGRRCDFSQLVREALDKAFPPGR
jgi:hypothetical protein